MPQPSEQDRQDNERIMRKAEVMGVDPARVARALDHRRLPPTEYQATEGIEPQAWYRRGFARRFARRRS